MLYTTKQSIVPNLPLHPQMITEEPNVAYPQEAHKMLSLHGNCSITIVRRWKMASHQQILD